MKSRSSVFWIKVTVLIFVVSLFSQQSPGFSGVMISNNSARSLSNTSHVVLVRDAEKTVLTIASDYKGDPSEFAFVIPVPMNVVREQINVTENNVVDRLIQFTSPRFTENTDADPCAPAKSEAKAFPEVGSLISSPDTYTVGDYEISTLSPDESTNITAWLKAKKYRVSAAAEKTLQSYVADGFKFFVARVKLNNFSKTNYSRLRPIQVAYNSSRFSLPIRLGTLNTPGTKAGTQDLVLMTITKNGRVESSNYRLTNSATSIKLPLFTKSEIKNTYDSILNEQLKKTDRAVLLEHAWELGWCDPCVGEPLTKQELKKLGVFWIDEVAPVEKVGWPGVKGAIHGFVTRLRMRISADKIHDDLSLQETTSRENFQTRFMFQKEFNSPMSCAAADSYKAGVQSRLESDARQLALLTNWPITEIRAKMNLSDASATEDNNWWKDLWKK